MSNPLFLVLSITCIIAAVVIRTWSAYGLWKAGRVPWHFMIMGHHLEDGSMILIGFPYSHLLGVLGLVFMILYGGIN